VRLLGDEAARGVAFIHGLGASLRYWGTAYDQLAGRSRLVFVDLLGFGGSEKPAAARYDIAGHVERAADTLREFGVERPLLVGHSTGGIVAMALAAHELPESGVVAFGAPIFASEDIARRHLRKLGAMERLMADRSPGAHRLCAFVCDHRGLARRLAPLFAPTLPVPIAADGVDHIWESYSGTFESLMKLSDVPTLAGALRGRLRLMYGTDDRTVPALAAQAALGGGAPISVVPGDHHLPLRRPHLCRRITAEQLSDG
jgi:pimeloyl-ACP methyl ester carboxylesterase